MAEVDRVLSALNSVGLDYLVRRWGLKTPSAWARHLSGGEMQRLGLARLLYHQPTFAFLDEATSALDLASEERCLQFTRSAGITLISVSHRESVKSYHSHVLRLAGGSEGAWEMKPMI